MESNEYQKLVMRTSCFLTGNCENIKKDQMLLHAVLGLNYEAGEVAGILQKEYQGHKPDMEHLKKELGDCLWMIAEACESLDVELEDIMKMNIEKMVYRYPQVFSDYNSLNRAKGDI